MATEPDYQLDVTAHEDLFFFGTRYHAGEHLKLNLGRTTPAVVAALAGGLAACPLIDTVQIARRVIGPWETVSYVHPPEPAGETAPEPPGDDPHA